MDHGPLGGLAGERMLETDSGAAARFGANRPLRIVMVDDHPILRTGLRALLAAEPDFEIVGEGEDSASAIELATRLAPDLVLMDVSMPGVNGAETTRILKNKYPNLVVLALSVHEDVAFVQMLLDAGASGYALKRSACDELVRASRLVASGERYVDPSLLGPLTRLQRSGVEGKARAGLSEREAEVMRLLAHGLTMKEIAQQLEVSPRTLETYRARAMDKLSLKSRADLVRFALRCGWLKILASAP